MEISISNRQKRFRIDLRLLRQAVFFIAQSAFGGNKKLASEIELDVILVDNKASREIHAVSHNLPSATDVITMIYPSLGEDSAISAEIIVNLERAWELFPSPRGASNETLFYIAHGFDHVLGNDDDTPRKRAAMHRREHRWLGKVKSPRQAFMRPSASTHIVGIAGSGMSALAAALRGAGYTVTGSDRRFGDQDGRLITNKTARVVVSTAIEADNPEILAAKVRGIPVQHRAEALAELISDRKVIAVAGTSGKSSTAAMLAWILRKAGLDPLFVNGAAIIGEGAVFNGNGDFAVIEADESDRSFLKYKPFAAIITNISADHFPLEETEKLFEKFRRRVKGPVITGGTGIKANADQAFRMALALGVAADCAREALATFPGIERRLQFVGTFGSVPGGVHVIDDFAHNPAKLGALWETLREKYSQIIGVWRPHGYAPVRNNLSALASTFSAALRANDSLIFLPIYDAGGTALRNIRSEDLAKLINHKSVFCAADFESARELICRRLSEAEAGASACVLISGARDPELPKFAKELTRRARSKKVGGSRSIRARHGEKLRAKKSAAKTKSRRQR